MLIAGRYRLHTALGRGAMGEVWRASDETLGRDVAVKLMLGQDADPTATSRFRLEAQTAGRLHHGNVVGVLDFGEYEGNLFLVMELVAGDSLARILSENGPLPADRVARIAAHTAAGLAVAHDQGIVHRDIKPGNLLVDADGTTKIADFGIARFMDDPGAALTRTGHIVGTSLYLAPERALGQNAGPPSDVYSLGCVLYQLLTGGTPFKGESPVAVLHHHLDTPPVPPRELGVDLPPAFENYLLGLLAKRPEDRPTARQVAEYFGGGAWQGRPEPLPAAAPSGPQGTGRRAAPGPGPGRPEPAAAPRQQRGTGTRAAGRGAPAVSAAPGAGPRHGAGPGSAPSYPGTPSGPGGSAETGPPTTYKLPTAAAGPASSAHRGRRRQQPSGAAAALAGRRTRIVALLAGVALFVGAMLLGMAWFGDDEDSPGTDGGTDTPPASAPQTPGDG
ncbi:serine/threonine-protein kinase [Streptomyces griseoaurantiacus]|uniref:non-specific serine/threonine protein kinase n=5 Tax=Streptomyces TaxID=1883 RepID=A0A7W2DWX6_9ACTN|nr:serine/threonine-protein kinase [Streptomyces griseoaurantiacus]MBA5224503.1 protein kinase [Streptomyces griseoaurantiacus]